MQVKDYIQALTDDDKIRVEKIGSGNWYWSFAGEELRAKEQALEKATEEHRKATTAVEELQQKIDEATTERQDEEGSDDAIDRAETMAMHDRLVEETNALKIELASYSQNDPVEMERRKTEAVEFRAKVDTLTDQIIEMESYLVGKAGMDRATALLWKREMYGTEFIEEEEGLREL